MDVILRRSYYQWISDLRPHLGLESVYQTQLEPALCPVRDFDAIICDSKPLLTASTWLRRIFWFLADLPHTWRRRRLYGYGDFLRVNYQLFQFLLSYSHAYLGNLSGGHTFLFSNLIYKWCFTKPIPGFEFSIIFHKCGMHWIEFYVFGYMTISTDILIEP